MQSLSVVTNVLTTCAEVIKSQSLFCIVNQIKLHLIFFRSCTMSWQNYLSVFYIPVDKTLHASLAIDLHNTTSTAYLFLEILQKISLIFL